LTLAICQRCGQSKFGAYPPCPDCAFAPQEPADLARAVFLTDHYHSHEELERFANQIKARESVAYDERFIADEIESLQTHPEVLEQIQHPGRIPTSRWERLAWVIIPWSLFALCIIAAIAAMVRFVRAW
jgi:hypothetical protein